MQNEVDTMEYGETLSEEVNEEKPNAQLEREEFANHNNNLEIQQKKGIWNRLKEKIQNSKIFRKIMRRDEIKRLPEATIIREATPRRQNKLEWDLQNYGTTKEEFDKKVNALLDKREEQSQDKIGKQEEKEEEQL